MFFCEFPRIKIENNLTMDAPACESCKIAFIASDAVFATFCGHLFHQLCLDRISDCNFKRCPGCQIVCVPSQSLRIYLPFQEETSTPEKLAMKCKMVKHELRETQKELEAEIELQTHLETGVEHLTAMKNRKLQKVAELKAVVKEKENLERNIKETKKLYSVRKALSETQNYYDVDKLVEKKKPNDTLATMVAAMRSETVRIKKEKTEARTALRENQKENEALIAKHKNLREKYELAIARSIRKGRN